MWFSESGGGDPLVILHPGGTDSRSMQSLVEQLSDYRCILIDRPGHGRSPDVAGEWSFAAMADAIIEVLDRLELEDAHVLGWSDGAIVGLQLALDHPERVRSLVFGGAPFQVPGWLDGVLGEDPPSFLADSYAEASPDGAGHWSVVVGKAARLHEVEPAFPVARLGELRMPVLVLSGDDDEVRFEHLLELYRALPDGELAIVPRATHALPVEQPDLVARFTRDLHRRPRANGFAPVRRSSE